MVTISKPISASQAQAYHQEQFQNARENYYTEGDKIRGEWHGRLAAKWGLRGAVDEDHFARLAEGQHPETGEQLVRHQTPREYLNDAGETVKAMEHRAGWDATFSAPKSVSLTALVGHDGRVRQAHRESLDVALDEMEKYVQARMGGNNPAVTTREWAAAKFEHDSSRPVDGYVAPQLHTHVVFFNITELENGETRGLQPQELYRTQQYATAVYRSELAVRLRELGYEIEPGQSGAPEIRGYSAEYLEASSPLDAYSNTTNYTVNIYSPGGQKLGAYLIAPAFIQDSQTEFQVVPSMQVTLSSSDTYFGSRRLGVMDQLGSTSTFYPWGEAKGTNPQNTWNFATYWQDSTTGLDYANNRYYSNAYGRFMTPDLYQGTSGGPGDSNNPQSWNRYAYVLGDPVNWFDPQGLDNCSPGDPLPCTITVNGNGGSGGGSGGGGGGSPNPGGTTKNHNSAPPPPPCVSQYSTSTLNFIQTNYAAALTVATTDSVPVDWILAWAAQESGWGSSSQTSNNDNFLNETTTPTNPTGGWLGAVACPANAVPGFACFNSFQGSLTGALSTTHQTWSQPGESALQIMQSMLAANPSVSEASVFQAIANAGFDPVGTSTNAGYGTRVANTNAAGRINCLRNMGALN